jgi:hypothetical protein
MSDVSCVTNKPHQQLEGVFSFDLSLEELNELNDRATRLNGESPSRHTVQLLLHEGKQNRWVFAENNVTGWYVSHTISSCLTGWVTFPLAVWTAVVEVFTDVEHVNITVDTEIDTFRITDGVRVVTAHLPEQQSGVDPYWDEDGTSITVGAKDLAKIGRVLMTTPTSIEDIHVAEAIVPFAQLSCVDGVLEASRDWKNFYGGKFSISVPAVGEWNRQIEVCPFPLAGELYAADIPGDVPVTLTILSHHPQIVTINGGQWGFFVEVTQEGAFQYTPLILAEIASQGFDSENDSIGDDGHVVNVFVEDDLVSISVVGNEESNVHYVRADLIACRDVPRTEFIAQEINSWNNSLEGIKIIQRGQHIIVRYEALAQHYEDVISRLSLIHETAEGFRLLREVFA